MALTGALRLLLAAATSPQLSSFQCLRWVNNGPYSPQPPFPVYNNEHPQTAPACLKGAMNGSAAWGTGQSFSNRISLARQVH
jgi:hypothetical protein